MDTLLEVSGLYKYFDAGRKSDAPSGLTAAIKGISFSVSRGETLGVVGESGCGKSTLARLILRLLTPSAGRIIFEGQDIAPLSGKCLKPFRQQMQIVFQDPFSSLNPQMTVGSALLEPLQVHRLVTGKAALQEAVGGLLEQVGLGAEFLCRYPHELSGGQLQRIAIARALALKPRLLVCDEPVSSLDLPLQSHIINLLEALQKSFGLTYIIIAHDLRLVRSVCDRVAVMYAGRIVEIGPTGLLFSSPAHHYTRELLSAIPEMFPARWKERSLTIGADTASAEQPPGCCYRALCPEAGKRCAAGEPLLQEVQKGHLAACHRFCK